MHISIRANTNSHVILILFFCAVFQATPSVAQNADHTAQEPLRIDAVTGVRNLLKKPKLAYPKEARRQQIKGKVEIELTVSPQGYVVSERVISGPSALQQATMEAFKKVKYQPFVRDGKPAVALVQAIVAYEWDGAAISTESENTAPVKGDDFGLGTGVHGRQLGHLELLTDPQGVDFGPYFKLILGHVRSNWFQLIPESAKTKKGKLAIEFAIAKDGRVADMKLVATSGDVALDRSAWSSITASDPFPPLPSEFGGRYIALRFRFYYNPDQTDLK